MHTHIHNCFYPFSREVGSHFQDRPQPPRLILIREIPAESSAGPNVPNVFVFSSRLHPKNFVLWALKCPTGAL
jgi:hypothetical protein